MGSLPQQMLDNLTPGEWIDHAYRERIIPQCVGQAVDAEVKSRLLHYEEELLNEVREDFIAEYARGYGTGREETVRSIRESLDRC